MITLLSASAVCLCSQRFVYGRTDLEVYKPVCFPNLLITFLFYLNRKLNRQQHFQQIHTKVW